jgi:hypothetical protein
MNGTVNIECRPVTEVPNRGASCFGVVRWNTGGWQRLVSPYSQGTFVNKDGESLPNQSYPWSEPSRWMGAGRKSG